MGNGVGSWGRDGRCECVCVCSYSSMFPRFYVLASLYSRSSMFGQLYVPSAPRSHSLCSYGSIFAKVYIPTTLCSTVLCFQKSIFLQLHVPTVDSLSPGKVQNLFLSHLFLAREQPDSAGRRAMFPQFVGLVGLGLGGCGITELAVGTHRRFLLLCKHTVRPLTTNNNIVMKSQLFLAED